MSTPEKAAGKVLAVALSVDEAIIQLNKVTHLVSSLQLADVSPVVEHFFNRKMEGCKYSIEKAMNHLRKARSMIV